MSDELKPCPFCGELLIPTQSGDGYTHNRRVRNANDCVLSWIVIRSPHHVAWNTRADLPATDAQAMANPKVQALVEALRWYADKTHWEQTSAANDDPHDGRLRDIWNGNFADGWAIARAALAALEADT